MLHVKIIEHSEDFMHPDFLKKLQYGKYQWISEAFLKTRADSTMTEK